MLVQWLRRWRSVRRGRAPSVPPAERYENPYRNGICAADWTKK
jgi:hypothetical protein